MSTYPEMLAERFRRQARPLGLSPERLLLQEMLDMNRAYMLGLEILSKESPNVNSDSQRVSD